MNPQRVFARGSSGASVAFAAAAMLGLIACATHTVVGGPISGAELSGRIASGDAPLILDVRTPEEFGDGHIPGALNIPHDQLEGRLSELRIGKADEVVVH